MVSVLGPSAQSIALDSAPGQEEATFDPVQRFWEAGWPQFAQWYPAGLLQAFPLLKYSGMGVGLPDGLLVLASS